MSPEHTQVPARCRLALAPAALCVTAAVGLTGCGDRKDDRASVDPSPTVSKTVPATPDPAASAVGGGEPVLIKTSIIGPAGKVVRGSVLAQAAFCPRGTVRHDNGSPEIGLPAVNVFTCTDGRLKIGFGPGPEQMNNLVQTSEWKILGGSGQFAGLTGSGQMVVQWSIGADSATGQETFVGRVSP